MSTPRGDEEEKLKGTAKSITTPTTATKQPEEEGGYYRLKGPVKSITTPTTATKVPEEEEDATTATKDPEEEDNLLISSNCRKMSKWEDFKLMTDINPWGSQSFWVETESDEESDEEGILKLITLTTTATKDPKEEEDKSIDNLPSYEATTLLDEEKIQRDKTAALDMYKNIDVLISQCYSESETSPATEESDEEIDEKKEDVGCRSLPEEMAVLLNPPLKYALCSLHKWEEGVPCRISPCPKKDGDYDYLCTNILHTWPDLRKVYMHTGVIQAGLRLASFIDDTDYTGMIERRVVCGPGFLKLKLSMKWIARSIFRMIKGDIAAWAPKLPVEKVIIYFLSPNIAEEMHTGHLRSTLIGETLARVLEYSGVEVIRRFHEGDDLDVKLKMMTEFIIEKSLKGKFNVQAVGEFEVLYKESKKRFDEDAEFRDRVQQSQNWDEVHENAWLQISEMSREHYQEVYQRLGVRVEEVSCFDPFYKIRLHISAALDLLRENGLTVESEGDKEILIEGRKLPLVELTALWHALNMVKADWIVHVTDVGQRDYFEMCIIAAKRAGWIVNDHSPCPLRHAGFGLVQANDFDRFQTLSTEVVSLVNLFEEAKSRCKAILVGQAEKLEHNAEALGYDVVKYAVLKANRLANYTINFNEMLNEKEDTVVYLQYTHVQISSLLEKFRSRIDGLKESTMEDEELILKNSDERELGLHLLRFTEVLEEVCKVLMPHILCKYLYELCKKFDKMYSSECQVLDPNDKSKLVLCEATARVMRKCFEFLGITPIYEEMLKVPPVAEMAIRVPFSDPTEKLLLKEPRVAEPAVVIFFSDLTEERLMELFSKGPCFRFELCNVLLKHNTDDLVENGGTYDELRLFGTIQAETHISDPSHYGSINIFKRNFDDPLVFNNTGSLSPHDIHYCSLSVSTFVKITAEVYGTTYKGGEMESSDDYAEWYHDTWKLKMKMEMDKGKYLEGLKEFFLTNKLVPNDPKESKVRYVDDDTFEVCDDYAFINFSDYFANKPNGGSGSCILKGKDGNIELYYVALKYAVEATLEADFAATSEETKVVGKVMTYYGKSFCYGCPPTKKDHFNAMLFETEPDSDMFVKPGKIDLTRSVLAVPAQFSLVIDAKLCDFTSGDIILSGVWEFLVPTDGRVCNGVIEGNECSLKLKVEWKLPPDVLEFGSLFS